MTEPLIPRAVNPDGGNPQPRLFPRQDTTGGSGGPDTPHVNSREMVRGILSGDEPAPVRRSAVRSGHSGSPAASLTPPPDEGGLDVSAGGDRKPDRDDRPPTEKPRVDRRGGDDGPPPPPPKPPGGTAELPSDEPHSGFFEEFQIRLDRTLPRIAAMDLEGLHPDSADPDPMVRLEAEMGAEGDRIFFTHEAIVTTARETLAWEREQQLVAGYNNAAADLSDKDPERDQDVSGGKEKKQPESARLADGQPKPAVGDDLPPPSDNGPSELGEFADDETVLEMPEPERGETLIALEQFAAGGRRYEDDYLVHDSDGEVPVSARGYKRRVPRGALLAEGLTYDEVEVVVLEDSTEGPYTVGINAIRFVTSELDLLNGDGELVTVNGEESKAVAFMPETLVSGTAPIITIDASNTFVVPPLVQGEAEIIMVDGNTSLLTLGETRAIMRAIAHADEYPDEPVPETALENSAALATNATLGRTEFSDVEIPEEGDVYTDLPQPVRGLLMTEIDQYARSGKQHPHMHLQRYTRAIPDNILRAHGLEGSATAMILEEPGGTFYGVGVISSQAVERDFPVQGGHIHAEGLKEGYLAVFAVTGPKTGSEQDRSSDKAAGDGLHLTYGAQETYQDSQGHTWATSTPDITYKEVRSLLQALLQANNQVEGNE